MPDNLEAVIDVQNVKKHFIQRGIFGFRKPPIKSVNGITFSLRQDEVMGIIGESGCGKSTLGRMLAMMDPPTEGSVNLFGVPSRQLLKDNPLSFRRKVQMVFQNPFDTFDPLYTIGKTLLGVLKLHHIGENNGERMNLCLNLLEKYNLTPAEDLMKRFPHELSGGQLQRISILRSMLVNPQFIVADEPISMLDVSVRADILMMLLELCKENHAAMVFISHDIVSTRYIADRIAVMYLGRFVEVGETDDVLHNAMHPYTQALISNSITTNHGQREVIHLKGEPPSPDKTGAGCYFYSRCRKAQSACKDNYPDLTDVGGGHLVSCFYPG